MCFFRRVLGCVIFSKHSFTFAMFFKEARFTREAGGLTFLVVGFFAVGLNDVLDAPDPVVVRLFVCAW